MKIFSIKAAEGAKELLNPKKLDKVAEEVTTATVKDGEAALVKELDAAAAQNMTLVTPKYAKPQMELDAQVEKRVAAGSGGGGGSTTTTTEEVIGDDPDPWGTWGS